ncbi:response regulator [Taklimakanibacter deserti]|uniref:response regulator n=1 Tax=Taklimakanibacter deserti TaxID=2267839 RepID=UPI0034D65C2D
MPAERNNPPLTTSRPMMRHVLVVDDDPAMREMLAEYLEAENFKVSTVTDGEAMSGMLRDTVVDIIILDMRLGKEDGLDLMRRLGSPPPAPIIVITGHRLGEADRILGLELGADDYVAKPFSPRELLARIRAVLRRSHAPPPANDKTRHSRYHFAGWKMEMRTRRLTSPAGEVVALTVGEFNLLAAFLRSPKQILTREQLLSASHVHDEEVFDRSIDVQILRLRRKLEADPRDPKLIATERGVGYRFAVPVDVL